MKKTILSWNSLIDMRKNETDMLLVYVDGTYANSYVKIGSSSIPLSSLRSGVNHHYLHNRSLYCIVCEPFVTLNIEPLVQSKKFDPAFAKIDIDQRQRRGKYVHVKI